MFAMGRYVSPPIRLNLGAEGLDFKRADIEVYGVDLSGPSYEGRVFLNNPDADADTPPAPENGYAGSFHVYGYGIWPGDIGKATDASSAGHAGVRAPIQKEVIATEAVRRAAAKGGDIIVTIVPVYHGKALPDASDALKLDGVRIVPR
jgi:hypothetical protein